MPGTSRVEARWKVRKAYEVARECEVLKTRLACLSTEMQHKQDYAGRLELVVRERNQRIDYLIGIIDQLRQQNRQLDTEAERLVEMVARPVNELPIPK
jgi:hypothetical protein